MTSNPNRFHGRLQEVMPSRAIDLRPRLARAVDALAALSETKCANAFQEINRRVDAWERSSRG
jgi:hypothetical protein